MEFISVIAGIALNIKTSPKVVDWIDELERNKPFKITLASKDNNIFRKRVEENRK